jgi:hypothetical protein
MIEAGHQSFFLRCYDSACAAIAWLPRVFRKFIIGLTICLLLAVVATGFVSFQILLVGVLDRFGLAPQYGFMSLNLLLVATLAVFILHPFIKSLDRKKEQVAFAAKPSTIATEPVCKLLIVRRLTPQNNRTWALQILRKRDNADEISSRNWLCGS